ncbi:MAG: response regulator transcription factor [Myxococcota bacterium]
MTGQVLVVEDDVDVSHSLSEYLTGEGLRVTCVNSAKQARGEALERFDVVVLDWMLPDGSGVDVLKEWRARGEHRPVILLTARTELVDRVLGLELGANDYVTKPFAPRELLARIRVQLRSRMEDPTELLKCGPLAMNLTTREVTFRERPVEMSRQELSLLELLLRNPKKVFSREEILNRAWGYDCFPTTRTVDTHVLQLRQKTDPALIETLRGIGYRLVELTQS